mmetsp:Transcript_21727/g.32977  ORF Transcript_21727/g.32977 Transcript_21727/m.32977 type:complete len:104 (-) Transcript_21727:27-338(-)
MPVESEMRTNSFVMGPLFDDGLVVVVPSSSSSVEDAPRMTSDAGVVVVLLGIKEVVVNALVAFKNCQQLNTDVKRELFRMLQMLYLKKINDDEMFHLLASDSS